MSTRTERLVNLVLCLLSTRQYISAARIREVVPGYTASGDVDDSPAALEAFKRMFERDKAELRRLGVPLSTGRNSIFDTEDGYRIARAAYELPDIQLQPDESAAVGLATRLWQSAGLADAAHGAVRKLRAAGIDVDPSARVALEPRVETTEAAFPAVRAAVVAAQAIAFDYRTNRRDAARRREVEPWGVVSWHGRWYVVGHDRDRGAPRCFRLSRIQSAVSTIGKAGAVDRPTGLDLKAFVASEAPQGHTARLRVAAGAAAGLRRRARVIGRDGSAELLEVDYGDPDALADRVAGYGSAVVVLEPPEVRDAVVHRLRSLAVLDTGGVTAAHE